MKKLYIFDLDGTLVNSIFDLADAMNAVLEAHGWAVHEVEEYKYFVGNGTLKLVERAVPPEQRSEESIKKLHEEFAENYAKRATNKTRPYEGIPQLLEVLKSRGCMLAVASNKPDRFSKLIVDTLFGSEMFDYVSGKKEGVPTKPSPEIMLEIINALGVDKSECVHSGDSDVDVLTAKNTGIECIGCTWGFRTEEELLRAGADYVAHSPMEISELI